jgi:isopropylmalate/homocitrate/citramalate synthase
MMLGIDMGMNFAKTYDLCKLVEKLSNVPLQSTKPLVGDKVFTTESGIAVSRLFRMKEKGIPLIPYSDSLNPEFVGRTKGVMIGKKSGRASIEYKLKEMGMDVPPVEVQQKILEEVKDYSLKNKKAVPDQTFKTIVKKVLSAK